MVDMLQQGEIGRRNWENFAWLAIFRDEITMLIEARRQESSRSISAVVRKSRLRQNGRTNQTGSTPKQRGRRSKSDG